MSTPLHNLLPPPQRRALHRSYRLRLLGVALAASTAVLCIGVGMLVPSFVSLHGALESIQEQRVSKQSVAEQQADFEEDLEELRTLLSRLEVYDHTTHTMDLIDTVLMLRPDGVRVSGVAYGQESQQMRVYGNAVSRTELVAYRSAFQNDAVFDSVELPPDSYVNEDLAFVMTLGIDKEHVDSLYD